jgi:formylglycine-generating enzyme required for sulfatase activity
MIAAVTLAAVLCLAGVVFLAVGKRALRAAENPLRVPAGFRAKEETTPEPYTNTGYAKEIVHEKTGIEMVFIPAGEFMMGSPQTDKNRDDDEAPLHRVRITRPFYMAKYELTQGEWEEAMGTNPSHCVGSARLPVDGLTWNDCWNFARKAGDGLTLPTEAQWEYACRAGSRTTYAFGDDTGEIGLAGYAWYMENSGGTTHDVGQKKPNAWGLYDMHGNVWEWCLDWYGKGYYAESPGDDPQGPNRGPYRVLRGGGWVSCPAVCRSAMRMIFTGSYRSGDHGGRLVLEIP